MRKIKIFGIALISLLVLVSSSVGIYRAQSNSSPEEPHNASAMWIEPSQIEYHEHEWFVGTKFNVTLWANTSFICTAWQFKLVYNKNHLTALRCQYTGITQSDFFQGIATLTVSPIFGSHNSTHDYVYHGEAWLIGPKRNPGYGSLSWIEFNITAAPPVKQELTSLLSISATAPQETFFRDEFGIIAPFTTYDSLYTYTRTFPWDITGDDYVGIDDIIEVAEHFGETP